MTFSPSVSPKARQHQLVIQELPNEILVYDLERNRAFCLNETVAFIWQNSDGFNSVSQLAYLLSKRFKTPIDEAVIWYALQEMERENLLASPLQVPPVMSGMNRRQLIGALGKASAIALPIVISITAPNALSAASACGSSGTSCTAAAQCCNRVCRSNSCSCLTEGIDCNVAIPNQCCSGLFCGQTDFGDVCSRTGGGGGNTNTGGGGGGGGTCLLYDTPILQADGQKIKAVDVFAGQELLGINCVNGEKIAGKVKSVNRFLTDGFYSLTAESGDTIHCTPAHPIIKGFGDTWGTPVEKFRIGDTALVYDEQSRKVVEAKTVAVEYIKAPQPVIIFEMDTQEHTFVSGGIVSHNKRCLDCEPV